MDAARAGAGAEQGQVRHDRGIGHAGVPRHLASDALQGRQIYTEGYGLAAAYVADHLRQWGVKPMGDDGTYFQTVKNRGYRVTRNSSVTVEVGGQSQTFKHGDHVTFPIELGRQADAHVQRRRVRRATASSRCRTPTSTVNYNDFAGRDVKGRAVMYMAGTPAIARAGRPRAAPAAIARTMRSRRLGAAAVFAYAPAPAPRRRPIWR